MTATLVAALKQEIAGLEAALRADPTYMKLQAAKAMLALYERPVAENATAPTKAVNRPLSPSREKALELAEAMLKGRTAPTPTREIVAYIQSQGFEIPGKDPISNLSAMLSQRDQFKANGRAGWTYVLDAAAREDDTPAHEGRAEGTAAGATRFPPQELMPWQQADSPESED